MAVTTLDPRNIVYLANARVRIAPVGTTVPTTFTSPTWDPAWKELGFITDKGITLDASRTYSDVKVVQQMYPALKIPSDAKFDIKFELNEWIPDNIAFAFGGGTWETTGGVAHFIPADPGTLAMYAMALDWQAQGHNWRILIAMGLMDGNVAPVLTRTNDAFFAITFSALGTGNQLPWEMYTDAPAAVAAP